MKWTKPLLVVVALCLAVPVLSAPQSPNFSGTYRLSAVRGSYNTKGDEETLTVVQSAASVLVTENINGVSTANTYLLDAREGPYADSRGTKGSCKGYLKGKYLFLESLILAPPPAPHQPMYSFRTRERWELSRDLKKLTIRVDIGSPTVAPEISAAVFGGSGFKIFTRE